MDWGLGLEDNIADIHRELKVLRKAADGTFVRLRALNFLAGKEVLV